MAKEWAWSYSKYKNYLTCPKRHYEVDVLKNFKDESEQLVWGNEVHDALAKACSGKGELPESMSSYQKYVDAVRASPGKLYVEQKYAITRNFEKTSWFGDNVWYRGICDLLIINGDSCTAIDWKTGKVQHDSIQLMLMSTCIFVHHPEVQTIKTRFVWLKEDCTTRDVFQRSKVMGEWAELFPEIASMQKAAETLTYPPKPNKLCRRYCPVTSCPFHGKTP